MAQKVNIILVDDIDGREADETVVFAIDGNEYAIDLTDANASRLREALAPYVAHARRHSSGGKRRGRAAAAGGPSASDIRDWARAAGMEVSERGRVSAQVRAAYEAAH